MSEVEDQRKETMNQLKKLLRELFQIDVSEDLDFGIFRVMNKKRDEINKFIDEKLEQNVIDALGRFVASNTGEIEKEVSVLKKQIISTLGDSAFENEQIKEEFKETKIAKDYVAKKKELDSVSVSLEDQIRIYNEIYNFFKRYYRDGDFISLSRQTTDSPYSIPYKGEEVLLHWATKDQYYIKTTEDFNTFSFDLPDGYKVVFRIHHAVTPQNNNKMDDRLFVLKSCEFYEMDEENKTLTVFFEYRLLEKEEGREFGKNQNQINSYIEEKLLSVIENQSLIDLLSVKVGENNKKSALLHYLNKYTTKNTSDYFIHKNLGAFLRRELDFFLKNEILHLDDLANVDSSRIQRNMSVVQAIKEISENVIDFVAQIEEFQLVLWEKKKFVVRADYCMTLDKIPNVEEFYDDILANEAQTNEWLELFQLDKTDPLGFKFNGKFTKDYLENHPNLVLDTRHFDGDPAFKQRLLGKFDDLDEAVEGILVKSENWQALNLMEERFKGQVKAIYIDPPYNAKSSEILYKNTFKHSSWLSLMENRIAKARNFLRKEGVFVIAIDENEQERLGMLLNDIFPGYDRTCVSIIHNPGGIQGNNFSYTHEYAYFIYPDGKNRYIQLEDREDNPDIRPLRDVSTGNHLRTDAANCFYPIYVKDKKIIGFGDVCNDSFHPDSVNVLKEDGCMEIYPIDAQGNERKWVFARDTVETILSELSVVFNKKREIWDIERRKCRLNYKTVWTDKKYNANSYGTKILNGILGKHPFTFPKSVYNTLECINATTQNTDRAVVLDFFAGSGTTAHSILNLNREEKTSKKYILVEMGEYFDTVLKPRIVKLMFSSDWKNTKPASKTGFSHVFKYLSIEQYEDSLNNIAFSLPGGSVQTTLDKDPRYMLRYMLNFESRDSPCRLNIGLLERPFEYKMDIVDNHVKKDDVTINIVETFNYLLGLHVERFIWDEHNNRRYCFVVGRKEGNKVVVVWRDAFDFDEEGLKKDREFIESKLKDGSIVYDKLYVNGQYILKDAIPIEKEFKVLMGA